MILGELLFWVALARTGTRHRIRPLRVVAPEPPADREAYRAYLGVDVERRPAQSITFSAGDAARPFLMANDAMWQMFGTQPTQAPLRSRRHRHQQRTGQSRPPRAPPRR